MTIKPAKKRSLTPRLRFPEFQGEWEYVELGCFLKDYSEKIPADTELPVYSSTREGLKAQKDYFDGRELLNDGVYGVVPSGYFVYRHMSDDNIFAFNINSTGQSIAVSKEYPVFKTESMDSYFLYYVLNYGSGFKQFAAIQKKGGTRTRLYFATLCSWKALLPTLSEQQKIANCLSSLDERITVETQKLDALKAHKKGLLQQLFPAEGETVPRLRFPEFREAGDWEEKRLGKLFSERQENNFPSLPLLSLTEQDGVIPQEQSNRKNNANGDRSKYLRVVPGDIVYNTMRMWEGRSALVGLEGIVSPAYTVCTPISGNSGLFFSYYFKTQKLIKQFYRYSQGLVSDTLNLKIKEFAKIVVLLPHSLHEQQKIADCLSSLDELIAAQTQKIDLLKIHKKGLMQQLFPTLDEVQA